MTWLLFLAVGFILGKMPAEFWAQLRAEVAAGAAKVWARITRKQDKPQ